MKHKTVSSIILVLRNSCQVNEYGYQMAINEFHQYLVQKKWGYYDGWGRQMKKCASIDNFFYVRTDKVRYALNKANKLLKDFGIKTKIKVSVGVSVDKPTKTDKKYIKWPTK